MYSISSSPRFAKKEGRPSSVHGFLAAHLMTLGPVLILLSFMDTRTKWACTLSAIQGFGWEAMILDAFGTRSSELKGYGVGLVGVYAAWIAVVLVLYRPSRFWMNHTKHNPQKS